MKIKQEKLDEKYLTDVLYYGLLHTTCVRL